MFSVRQGTSWSFLLRSVVYGSLVVKEENYEGEDITPHSPQMCLRYTGFLALVTNPNHRLLEILWVCFLIIISVIVCLHLPADRLVWLCFPLHSPTMPGTRQKVCGGGMVGVVWRVILFYFSALVKLNNLGQDF